ncbi:hypothetical protein Clacol_006084 [Clathrus columnatus]|uniref:Peptidase S53 domain-containing protein n=1 Tax=Clathrus columnatus TaxID=1419009 RepID=A0AAV5AFV1_9AGAM|nr:hypothetical protein Clacol_006084 [Clathrus columnatus]
MSLLETRLLEIWDPNNPDYRNHLTKEEVEAFVRPRANVTTAFTAWLSHHNITPRNATPTGNRLSVEMTVSQAEKVFNTTLDVYNHTSSGQTIIRSKHYSVPENLASDISFVHPSTHFPSAPNNSPRRAKVRSVVPSSNPTKKVRRDGCEDVTVNCVMGLYNIPTDAGVPSTDDEVVVLAFLGQGLQGHDVASFMKEFHEGVTLAQLRLEIVSVDIGDDPQGISGNQASEADIDVELLLGVAPQSRTTLLTTATTSGSSDYMTAFEFLLLFLQSSRILSYFHIIFVHALPGTDETDVPVEQLRSFCTDIAQLTSRGTTVVVGSGDKGVNCLQTSGTTTFQADFPASCPWSLAISGTQLSSDGSTETALGLTGGGFSAIFQMPTFQTGPVGSYISPLGSLNEVVHLVEAAHQYLHTPIVAGIIATINDHRHAQGKGPVGFINPLIYANNGSAFNDITQGTGTACSELCRITQSNESQAPTTVVIIMALSGWDAATGFGTPDFQKLLELLM